MGCWRPWVPSEEICIPMWNTEVDKGDGFGTKRIFAATIAVEKNRQKVGEGELLGNLYPRR